MIKKLGLLAVFASVMGIAQIASAHEGSYAIDYVGCFDNGTCFVAIKAAVPVEWSTCKVRNQFRFSVKEASGEQMYKTALAAHLAGRQIVIHNLNTTACYEGTHVTPWYLFMK